MDEKKIVIPTLLKVDWFWFYEYYVLISSVVGNKILTSTFDLFSSNVMIIIKL